ncbi:MAG: hypothetical protein AB7V48_08975 [Sedimentibacter sp.]
MKKMEVTNQNNFKVKKDAPFERCVDFMVRNDREIRSRNGTK